MPVSRSPASNSPVWPARRQQPTLNLVALTLLVVLISGCSDQGDQSGTATTASSTASPTATAGTPAGPVTGTSGCPSGVGSGAVDATQAARCLERAWKDASRSAAEVVASADAVDALFSAPWTPPDGALRPCAATPQTDGATCRYEYHGTLYLFVVQPSEGGWRVTHVQTPPGTDGSVGAERLELSRRSTGT